VAETASPKAGHQTAITLSYFIADLPIALPHRRRHLVSRFFRMQHATSPMKAGTNINDNSTK